MTVAELISELMKYGPMAEVKIGNGTYKDIHDITDYNKGDLVLISHE